MKKRISVILISVLACSLLLCGCGKKDKKDSSSSSGGGSKTGESVQVTLKTTKEEGFDWKAYVGDEKVLKVEKKDNDDNTYTFTVTALKEGQTDINFIYKRPEDIDVTKVAKYTYKVDKKLKLKEVSHEGTYFY